MAQNYQTSGILGILVINVIVLNIIKNKIKSIILVELKNIEKLKLVATMSLKIMLSKEI